MPYTLQQAFDKVVDHMLTQGKPARTALGCWYRMADKKEGTVLMCGVGCLIPDEKYVESLESVSASSLYSHAGEIYDTVWFRDLFDEAYATVWPDFLDRIQSIHDYISAGAWPDALTELAQKYDLIYKGVTL